MATFSFLTDARWAAVAAVASLVGGVGVAVAVTSGGDASQEVLVGAPDDVDLDRQTQVVNDRAVAPAPAATLAETPTTTAPATTTTVAAPVPTTAPPVVVTTTTAAPAPARPTFSASPTSGPRYTRIMTSGSGCVGERAGISMHVHDPSGQAIGGDGAAALPDGTWQVETSVPADVPGRYSLRPQCTQDGVVLVDYEPVFFDLTA